jgi:hypothetical protein
MVVAGSAAVQASHRFLQQREDIIGVDGPTT